VLIALAVLLLVLAVIGGIAVHPLLFALAILAAIMLFSGRRAPSRRESGEWLLHGSPPEQLRHHPLAAAMS